MGSCIVDSEVVADLGGSGKGPKIFKWLTRPRNSLVRNLLIAFKADIRVSRSHVGVIFSPSTMIIRLVDSVCECLLKRRPVMQVEVGVISPVLFLAST